MLDRHLVQSILRDIKYKDWSFVTEYLPGDHPRQPGTFLIKPSFLRIDVDTGEYGFCQNMRPWAVEEWRSEAYLVQTVFTMVKAAEEHEARENFTYRGERPYSPHKIEEIYDSRST